MAGHVIEFQSKMAKTLHKVQQQISTDQYMTDLKSCTRGSSEKFNSWILSIEKVSKLAGNIPFFKNRYIMLNNKDFQYMFKNDVFKSISLINNIATLTKHAQISHTKQKPVCFKERHQIID